MKAQDVMSSPVITLRPDTPVMAASALLASHGFTAAPVVDDQRRVIGIVTEADLIRDQIPPEGWPPHAVQDRSRTPIRAVMTPTPASVTPASDVAELVTLMLGSRIRSLPVVDDGELVGIVSRRDVLRAVARGELTSEDVWRRRAGLANHGRSG